MQNVIQQKSYRLTVQNKNNDLQDFDAIPWLPAGAQAEIFRRLDYFRGLRACSPRKILQNLQNHT